MFYNTEMLTKRGPLARVWMASHLSTKLSKPNLLATSIPSSVTSILGEALLPMALRLSGQLLLGVARIYSRKAKYLLDDCNETLSKVKRAFRPGQQVDLEDSEVGGRDAGGRREAINLRAEEGGIEDLLNNEAGMNYWDMDFNTGASTTTSKAKKANTLTNAQLTLAEDHFALGGGGMNDSGGFGSQTWGDEEGGIDLNLFGDDPEMQEMIPGGSVDKGKKRARSEGTPEGDEDLDVELGRDAADSIGHASARRSSNFDDLDLLKGAEGQFDAQGDLSMGIGKPFDFGEGADQDLGGMGDMMDDRDFFAGQEFGGGDERELTPQPADQNGDVDEETLGLTPKTAADVANLAKKSSAKRQKVAKKQVVDNVTELKWEDGSNRAGGQKENLFTEPHFLPRSRVHLRLLEMAADPGSNVLLPRAIEGDDDWVISAPPGLAPELSNLFQFQTRRARIAGERQRSPTEDREIEQGRRAGSELLDQMDMGGMGDMMDDRDFFAGQEFGGGDETNGSIKGFQFDLEEGEQQDDEENASGSKKAASQKKRSAAAAELKDDRSRRSSPARYNEDFIPSTSDGPLAIFDDASGGGMYASQSQQPTQSQQQSQRESSNGAIRESLGETEEEAILANGNMTQLFKDDKKLSKNTVKALGVLRNEFSTSEQVSEVVFEKVAEKASRRAAAAFFFELLVLSTRDCVKIKQVEAFGSIKVSAKEKLWEVAEPVAVDA